MCICVQTPCSAKSIRFVFLPVFLGFWTRKLLVIRSTDSDLILMKSIKFSLFSHIVDMPFPEEDKHAAFSS